MNSITTNLSLINQRMLAAAQQAGRGPGSVRLVAVSKFHPAEALREALEAGQRLFGENRVQEAKAKFTQLRHDYADIELHLIGPLQTNKAGEAIKIFDVIETLDRPELAVALAKAMKKANRSLPCYIEINSGSEPQKTGIAPEQLEAFLHFCRDQQGLTVTGLMCIPPRTENPHPHFARLRQLALAHNLSHISMGMSADFEAAIEEGTTEIRIGTAIFGARKHPL